jgi:hypothetical protein
MRPTDNVGPSNCALQSSGTSFSVTHQGSGNNSLSLTVTLLRYKHPFNTYNHKFVSLQCTSLQLIYQSTNTLQKIHCTTSVTLLRVSEREWHSQAVFWTMGDAILIWTCSTCISVFKKNSLRMALRCRNMQEFNTRHELYFFNSFITRLRARTAQPV